LRNVHVIEESDRAVRTERAHTESEHYQAIIVLLREAIQYSEHDFPYLRDALTHFSTEKASTPVSRMAQVSPIAAVELAELEGRNPHELFFALTLAITPRKRAACTISSPW